MAQWRLTRWFFRLKKNLNVACAPIVIATPATNRICTHAHDQSQTAARFWITQRGRGSTESGAGGEESAHAGAKQRRTLPIARRPLSKKNRTPRNVSTKPKPVKPMPISAGPQHRINMLQYLPLSVMAEHAGSAGPDLNGRGGGRWAGGGL